MIKSALIVYTSLSGNTEEVAELIHKELRDLGVYVSVHRIGTGFPPEPKEYDAVFIGTYTWDYGDTPDEVKDFVLDIGYKPENVIVFGTGDTQFGIETDYCRAADKVAKFYESKADVLKIEQSPRGSQEEVVINWLRGVL